MRFRLPALAALAVLAASACSLDPWSDRQGTTVRDIAVDSLRFMPLGSRFVLKDSAGQVAFLGYHAGYVCSKVLEMGVQDSPFGDPPAYLPTTRVQLPGTPTCAFDSGGRDTAVIHAFPGTGIVRLANAAGKVTDSALVVSGSLGSDSITGSVGTVGTFSVGHFTYREASSTAPRLFYSDSLPPCTRLNQADWINTGKGDTLVVRYTWVTLDPALAADDCNGPATQDSVAVGARRELRH